MRIFLLITPFSLDSFFEAGWRGLGTPPGMAF